MKKSTNTIDKIMLTAITLLLLLGLVGATSCKNPEKFKYDKPKFNLGTFFQRSK